MKKHSTAGIVLAAGMSSRMGVAKQLIEADGKPLLAWVLEAALQSDLEQVVLVLGHEAERILAALGSCGAHPRIRTVINEKYGEGMATSLHAGLKAVRETFPSVMFLLGDQPLVGTDAINLLLRCFWDSNKDICVPVCGEKQGNPVVFSSLFYDKILGIRGDKGARKIIRTHPCYVLSVNVEDPLCFLDVDSEEDLARLLPLFNGRDSFLKKH